MTSVSAVTGLDIFPLFEKFCRKDYALIAGILEKVKLLLSAFHAHCTFPLVLASLGPAISGSPDDKRGNFA